MFTRHAGFQGLGLRQAVPHWPAAEHANGSLRGHRRPTGQRRSSPPKPVCHWVLTGTNRLECRWTIENLGEICVEEPDGRRLPSKISGLPPTIPHRPLLATVSGRQ